MKKWILPCFLFIPFLLKAQEGYEIKITLKPFVNQYIYVGHYSGKQFPIIDSVLLNDKSEGVLKGNKALGGGIYVVAVPTRDQYFEMLIDKDQHFSVAADASNLSNRRFTGSEDNDDFIRYQKAMDSIGQQIQTFTQRLNSQPADSASIKQQIGALRKQTSDYRKNIISQKPGSFLATLMRLMEEPVIPPAEEHPGGKYDSLYAYQYVKSHYWEGLYFFDDRMVRTPASLFEERLDKYFNTMLYPDADSVIKELDYMLGYSTASKEMNRYLLVKFITRYLNQQYMWEDKVFVHLYQKYFSQKDPEWLTPEGKKMITERAYNLMANLIGNQAENIVLPDSTGTSKSLFSVQAPYTLVAIWDPTCGHCKEVLPKADSFYQNKWKNMGMKVFAMAKETDGNRNDWLKFIREHKLTDWINVYYSRAADKQRTDNNIPGYSQLYDAQVVPALYLLDKDKKIIAKKLTIEQIDEILAIRLKNN